MLPIVIVVFILAACDSSDNHSENLIRMPDGSVTVSDSSDISTIPLRMETDVDADTYQRLADFFNAELHHPYYMDGGQASLGFFGELEWDDQPCYLINSIEEFQSVYKGKEQLPEVDFDKYSVLVEETMVLMVQNRLATATFT